MRAAAIGALAALAFASPALAQDVQTDEYAAVYVSVAALGALQNHDYKGWSASDGGGFNIKVGYQWSRWFALDIGYELASFDVSPDFDNPDAQTTGLLTHYFPVNFKVFPLNFGEKPLLGRVHPMVQAGMGPMWAQVGEKQNFPVGSGVNLENRRGMVWQAGAGVEFEASDKVRAFLEGRYVAGMGSIDEIRYGAIGVGVMYRF